MGDFNKNILIHISHQYFSKLGLRGLIMDTHGTEVLVSSRSNKKNNAIGGI